MTGANMNYKPRQMTGRCFNGAERDRGRLYHAVALDSRPWDAALCGAKPGMRGNGWSDYIGEAVTCPRCLRKA